LKVKLFLSQSYYLFVPKIENIIPYLIGYFGDYYFRVKAIKLEKNNCSVFFLKNSKQISPITE